MRSPIKLLLLAALSLLPATVPSVFAQSTAFTYQGRLLDSNAPANAGYDFQFKLFDSASSGTLLAGPITISNQPVTNGLFTVLLDFGSAAFNGADRWLEIGVRSTNAIGFTTLNNRQKITPTPYALFAPNAGNVSGVLAVSNLPPNVALLNSNLVFNGLVQFTNPSNTYAGNGAGLTNIPVTSLNSGGVFSWAGGFRLTATPATGSVPVGLALGDFNRDGLMDIACVDNGDGTLMTFTNNGAGGFFPASTNSLGVSSQPVAVAAMDLNSDGKLDLLTANSAINSISVLTNNGSNGFVALTPLGSVGGPFSLAVADFNGDGRPDLAVANSTLNNLTVFTNNGAGGLILASQPFVNTIQSAVAVADVNGDGRPDLICADFNGNVLTVFTNNGNAQFTAIGNTPTVGVNPRALAVGDFNGDGRIDVACVNSGSATLTILTNNGSGIFSISGTYNTGPQPFALVATNLTGGTRPDLICANAGTNTFTILFNNGAGVFNSFLNIQAGQNPDGLVAGDLNGDGRPDLISTATGSNTLWVLLNAVTFHTGPLAVWGGFTVNSNVIYYSGLGTNIGINNTNPASALDVRGLVNATGGFTQNSDARFKTNISALTDALEKIMALRGVAYDWRRDEFPEMNFDDSRQLGFVAQELRKVLPEAVRQDAAGRFSVSYSAVIPVLVEALKEEEHRNAAAAKASEAKILELEKRLELLEKQAPRPAVSSP